MGCVDVSGVVRRKYTLSHFKRIVFVANRGYALTSSRTSIIQRFLSSGWEVIVATADDVESQKLCDLGAYLEPVIFNRGGLALAADIGAYRRLHNIYRKWQPALVHHFHAKPVVFGSLAAYRALGDAVQVVNTITGLGHAFITGGLSAQMAGLGYKFALPRTAATIFQNKDDRALFYERGWVQKHQARLITSSGVDTERFSFIDRHGRDGSRPVIVMLGRLLRQKGILEFVEVADRILQRWPEAKFLIAGEEDLVHPDAVALEWLLKQKSVEFLGRLTDVVPVLTRADLLLFPSYREGVPRVVLEAAAMGLPTVGFNVPGVREVVSDGQTGYLVPYRDVYALTECVTRLLENEFLRLRMGRKARKMVADSFEVSVIEEQYFKVYRDLGLVVL